MIESKKNFLSRYISPYSMKDFLIAYLKSIPEGKRLDSLSYDKITTINARSTKDNPNVIVPADTYELFEQVYNNCIYFYETQDKKGLLNAEEQANYEMIKNHKNKFNGQPTKQDIYDFFFNDEQSFSKKGMYAQKRGHIFSTKGVFIDFVHVSPFKMRSQIDCRLYLNINADYTAKLGSAIMEKCKQDQKRLYFKFHTTDSRNDNFLLYCSYENVQYFTDALNDIKKKNPSWFVGCEKTNPGFNMIDGFIGFGEEPKYKHSSFNGERSDLIDEYIDTQLSRYRKAIAKDTNMVSNSEGDNLGMKDYIVYRTKKDIIESINQELNQDDSKFYVTDVSRYKKVLVKLKTVLTQGNIPQYMNDQIEKYATRTIDKMKNGIRPTAFILDVKTTDPYVNNRSPEYNNEQIKKNGYTSMYVKVENDLESKLFKVFGVKKDMMTNVNEKLLMQLCEKYHVSYDYASLNIETDRELKQEKLV